MLIGDNTKLPPSLMECAVTASAQEGLRAPPASWWGLRELWGDGGVERLCPGVILFVAAGVTNQTPSFAASYNQFPTFLPSQEV